MRAKWGPLGSIQELPITMSEKNHALTGRQIAAARTLIGMPQAELAAASNISVPTLRRIEASMGPASAMPNNLEAVRRALESAGVVFIPENGGGPGVRLQKAGIVS
jgi:transcriptional regulator with XRE-family HTH domain